MADEKRSAACKKAWETIRANRAAGIAPASSCKTKAPEKDYTGMISRWLAPVAFDIPDRRGRCGHSGGSHRRYNGGSHRGTL